MKRKAILAVVTAVTVALAVAPIPRIGKADCLAVWKTFGAYIKNGEFAQAHGMLTTEDQKMYPLPGFTNTGVVAFSGLLDAPVIRFTSQPLLGRASFLATSSHLVLPLCLEDGFCVAEVRMVKEDGRWCLRLPMIHMR